MGRTSQAMEATYTMSQWWGRNLVQSETETGKGVRVKL